MARPILRPTVWSRIVPKLKHPEAHLIPYLAGDDPADWPVSLRDTPWLWTGNSPRHGPAVIVIKGTMVSVSRVIYTRLIGPIPPNRRLMSHTNLVDMNPLHYSVAAE